MPYQNINQLPKTTHGMTNTQKHLWLKVFNSSLAAGKDETSAIKIAHAAVNRLQKANKSITDTIVSADMYITKAALATNGQMTFAATASDTDPDVFTESMSLELFKSFVDKFRGDEYVSLSHYPRLQSGRAEVGLVTEFYIDGNRLKAKGYFHDTLLGRSVYNAIRKDRRDNVPEDQRVRVSIGFYDRKHSHADNIWEYSSGKPCVMCAMGVRGKVYLDGVSEHLAVTRVPANRRVDIEVD